MSFGNTNNAAPEDKKVLKIDADQVNTNQIGMPVPYMAGRRRIALHYVAPVYNPRTEEITTDAGKGGEDQHAGWNYFGDLAGLIAIGGRVPLAKLFRHIMESEIAWENEAGLALSASATAVSIVDRGQTWIYRGDRTQPIDSHVLTPIGPPPGTPGFDPRDPTTWPGYDPGGGHPDPP
jgi:hypothetical protein